MRNWLKKIYQRYNILEFRKNPFLWLYAAYLTIRYVDNFNEFPAIKFNSFVRVRVVKSGKCSFVIKKRLMFETFIAGTGLSTLIKLEENSKLVIENEFVFGDGIKVVVSKGASLILQGKVSESASGITGNSVIMVNKYLAIGKDCIIAWDTFITDCDWHSFGEKRSQKDTLIGDHVWIGVGVKILKGAIIGNDSVIGSNSVVLGGVYAAKSFITGIPGKIKQTNIPDWQRDMQIR